MLTYPQFETVPQILPTPSSSFAPTGTPADSAVVILGGKNPRDLIGSMGVELHFEIVISGGTTNSNVEVKLFKSFDGVLVDSEPVVTFTITSNVIASGTHRYTTLRTTMENAVGLGYAFMIRMTRSTGDRTLAVKVHVRRYNLVGQ